MKKILSSLFALAFISALAVTAWAETATAEDKVPMLTSEEYANADAAADEIYIMLVGASWCGPCHRMEDNVMLPLLKRFASHFKVKVVKVDGEEVPPAGVTSIRTLFQVQSYPTVLVVYRRGTSFVHRGFAPEKGKTKEETEKKLEAFSQKIIGNIVKVVTSLE